MVSIERIRTLWPLAPLMCALFFSVFGLALTLPSLVDVLLGAICPGQNECSEVIFLSGVQTTIVGIGTMVLAPIIGGLADEYGRKPVFLVGLVSSIAPALTLAFSREKSYVYLWWVLHSFGMMMREAGMVTITFAFVADVVPDPRQRAPAIGIAMSSISIGVLAGTLLARVLTTVQIFNWAAVFQIASAVVVQFFLIESHPRHCKMLLASAHEEDTEKLVSLIPKRKPTSMFSETIEAVRSSKMLRTMAAVAFMVNISETTTSSTLLYYLKAVFGFGKDEFAQILVLMGIVAIVSQMIVYPILAHRIGERGVLWVGLLGAAANNFSYAFAWADWVPYFACSLGVFYALVPAAIGTIVSRAADAEQQGRVQGLIVSVKTVSAIVGPIAMTPLTAAFLSDDPPFNFPGITIAISGTALILALLISLALPRLSTPDAFFQTVIPSTTDGEIIINTSEDIEGDGEKVEQVLIEP